MDRLCLLRHVYMRVWCAHHDGYSRLFGIPLWLSVLLVFWFLFIIPFAAPMFLVEKNYRRNNVWILGFRYFIPYVGDLDSCVLLYTFWSA